jgi:hypothetical protein
MIFQPRILIFEPFCSMEYLGMIPLFPPKMEGHFPARRATTQTRTSFDSVIWNSGSIALEGKCEETDDEQGHHVSIKFLICLIVTCICFTFYLVLLFNEFEKLFRFAVWIT